MSRSCVVLFRCACDMSSSVPFPADFDYQQAQLTMVAMEQVGVVCKGEPFPFWMRGQALLVLKVATAAPDDVVRLAPGAEVSIAPRPRVRKQQASGTPQAVPAADGERPELPPAWFRIQVGLI